MSLVSIIIPNYNNAKWLSKCIESCLDQKGSFRKEVIVVDDQSEDNSWEVLSKIQSEYPEELFIYKNPKKGANSARNYGYSKSNGDFIQWLDSDDYLLGGKFQNQLNFFESNPFIDVVYSDSRMDFFEENVKVREEVRYSAKSEDYLIDLLMNKWQSNSSYLLRRRVAEKLDLQKAWSEETAIGQDREYFTLAAINGFKFGYKAGVYSVYNRWSSNSISNRLTYQKSTEQSLVLNQRFYKHVQDSEELLKKNTYLRLLNSELLKAVYHHPSLLLPRLFWPWQFSLIAMNWKMALISPLIYLFHLSRM